MQLVSRFRPGSPVPTLEVQNTKLQHVLGAMPAFTHRTRAVQGGATVTKVMT